MTDREEPMTSSPTDGGTVRYHRAEWHGDFWKVWWSEDDTRHWVFPPDVGEAMGLTVPEPAPLVVTCNGHLVELSNEDAAWIVRSYSEVPGPEAWPDIRTMYALAGLLRDARQDPQPASDENAPGSATPGEQGAGVTCTPAPDTDSDDIDFDALPSRYVRAVGRDGVVRGTFTANGDVAFRRHPDGSVYFDGTQVLPALSPRQCLEALLAGRDDADELIEYAKQWGGRGLTSDGRWRAVIGDAARGGASDG